MAKVNLLSRSLPARGGFSLLSPAMAWSKPKASSMRSADAQADRVVGKSRAVSSSIAERRSPRFCAMCAVTLIPPSSGDEVLGVRNPCRRRARAVLVRLGVLRVRRDELDGGSSPLGVARGRGWRLCL